MNMRYWMTLFETSAQRVRVFHGSSELQLRFQHAPLYGVRDFGFAASYALDRARSDRRPNDPAFVHTLDFQFNNLCNPKTLYGLFDQHGIEPFPSAAGVFINNPEFMTILTDAGYDGLTAYDFGFRSDFEELPVWMVVDAARQAKWLDVMQVTRDHLGQSHEPT